jgi:uncharacterized protein
MPWLVRDDKVLATCEVAGSARSRRKGLLGYETFEGAILLRPARSVHTFGMRFALDVAFVDRDLEVIRVVRMPPNRLCRPVWRARGVIEAEAGAFAAWELRTGDQLELRGEDREQQP